MAKDWPVIAARVPQELVSALESWCTRSGWNRSRAIEQAIRDFLERTPITERPPKDPDPATGSSKPRPPKDPAPAVAAAELKRADRLAKLDLNDMALRVWNFSRSAERTRDPLAYIREVIVRACADQKVPDATEQEVVQILGKLKERSSTVKRLLAGEP